MTAKPIVGGPTGNTVRAAFSVENDFLLTKSEMLAIRVPIGGIHLHPGDSRRGEGGRLLFEPF
jgi:hypothetical protein